VNYVWIGCYNIFTVVQDTIHFYVTFIVNLVFSFIIYFILANVFLFKYHTCLVDIKFCKHVYNEFYPYFWGQKIKIQPTMNITISEMTMN
jgi:hypothetical protein